MFSPFGYTITILGGTLGELLAPLSLGMYFFWRRQVAATAFCGFWFFENFLYIGTYMADARNEALPLIGSGEHDWNTLFSQWGLIMQDQKIGAATRAVGWFGTDRYHGLARVAHLVFLEHRPRSPPFPDLDSETTKLAAPLSVVPQSCALRRFLLNYLAYKIASNASEARHRKQPKS